MTADSNPEISSVSDRDVECIMSLDTPGRGTMFPDNPQKNARAFAAGYPNEHESIHLRFFVQFAARPIYLRSSAPICGERTCISLTNLLSSTTSMFAGHPGQLCTSTSSFHR
jgi:hypothetical protein